MAANPAVSGQEKFKPGDRVERDTLGIGTFDKGTVLPYLAKDNPGLAKDATGKFHYIRRVRMDNDHLRQEGGMCFTDKMRALAGAAAAPPVIMESLDGHRGRDLAV